jgi:hypothetical protein
VPEQPEFDFDSLVSDGMSGTDGCKPTGGGSSPQASESTWQEVPQARFLSWSVGEQLAYCAARDYDAAEHETDLEWCQFYFDRARMYQNQIEAARG